MAKADVYLNLSPPPQVNDLGVTLSNAIIAAVVVDQNINSEVDGRIQPLSDTNASGR